jgi:hypothetical protein
MSDVTYQESVFEKAGRFFPSNIGLVYTELDEAMRISDISRVLIFSDEDEQGIEDGSNINPGYKPYDEGEVKLD